jgi:hypothetical protein
MPIEAFEKLMMNLYSKKDCTRLYRVIFNSYLRGNRNKSTLGKISAIYVDRIKCLDAWQESNNSNFQHEDR